MASDWDKLKRVRDQQRASAAHAYNQALQAVDAATQRVSVARHTLEGCLAQRDAYATTRAQASQDGAVRIDALQTLGSWRHAIEAQVRRADRSMRDAQQAEQDERKQSLMAQSRYRQATAKLEKAKLMQRRETDDDDRRRDRLAEQTLDEVALRRWWSSGAGE